jgi:hypothetical protein
MGSSVQVELLSVGLRLSAAALVIGAILQLVTGTSGQLGGSLRSTIEPVLHWVRERTPMTRSELADASIVAGLLLAVTALLVEGTLLAGLVAPGLWLARPSIERATREENKMLALGGYFSIDMMIGLYTPIMLAQFLLGHLLLGACLMAVIVGLSWPAGGGGSSVPGRTWRLATVTP